MSAARISTFSTRAVGWIAGIGGASLVLAFVLSGTADRLGDPVSPAADAYSRSAIGHRAFRELLSASGHEVRIRRNPETAVVPGGLWMLLEPPPRPETTGAGGDFDPVRDVLMARWIETGPIVLVPPKWYHEPHPARPGWVYRVARMTDELAVTAFPGLEELTGTALVLDSGSERVEGPCRSPWGTYAVAIERPRFVGAIEGMIPLLECDAGVLMAAFPYPDGGDLILVVSDPDLLANHGLGRADHARFVLDLVERHSEGGVLIDETIHGHRLDAGFLSELFRFPLILLLGHGVLLAAFAVWAGASRFGAPRSAPPALGLGRQVLIGNVAELIAVVGRTPNLLPRYDRQTVRAVARHFGFTPARGTAAGGAADEDAALGRIREIERLRGVDPTLDRIRAEAGPDGGSRRAAIERALKVSMRLHRWRTEMTHVD